MIFFVAGYRVTVVCVACDGFTIARHDLHVVPAVADLKTHIVLLVIGFLDTYIISDYRANGTAKSTMDMA